MKTLETEEKAEIEEEKVIDQLPLQEEEPETPESTTETVEDAEKPSEEPESKADEDDTGELVVSIEGDSPTPEDDHKDPGLPKKLRDLYKKERKSGLEKDVRNKDKDKRIEELEALLNPTPEIPPEPGLYDDGIEGDPTIFLAKNRERDKLIADRDAKKKAEDESLKLEQDKWDAKKIAYSERKASVKTRLDDYDDAVGEAESAFSELQRYMILDYFEKPELLIYALGKSPELENLAKITDNVRFIQAVTKLELKMKVGKRKPQTPPETVVVGSSNITGSDVYLEKLEKKYEKKGDGDRSEINAHQREVREKARAQTGN